MVDFLGGVQEAVRKAYCGTLSATEFYSGLLASAGLPLGAIQEWADQQRIVNCSKGLDSAENVGRTPGFSGGQCEGVSYRITMTYTNTLQDGSVVGAPSAKIVVRAGALKSYRVFGDGNSARTSASGTFVEWTTTDGVQPPTELNKTLSDKVVGSEITNVSIRRSDFAPDECGDPDDLPPEGLEEVEVLEDVEFEDDGGNPISLPNIPIKFFPPCISLVDGIEIPFEVEVPIPGVGRSIKVCGKVGVEPDLGGSDVIQPVVDIDICPDQIPGLEQKAAEQKKEFFELDERVKIGAPGIDFATRGSNTVTLGDGNPILAVFVESNRMGTPPSRATEVIREDYETFPAMLFPRIGYVRFKVFAEQESGVKYAYTSPIPIQSAEAYISCPSPFGAVAVEVRYEDGWQGSYEAARRKSCCEGCAERDPRDSSDQINRCNLD